MLASLASSTAAAFEPLCNSVGAGGGNFSDGCGACTEDSAARWEPASVTFVFDRSVTPVDRGVSTTRFAQDITDSLAAWNAVPSSSLVLSDGGALTQRVHDANRSEHAVYWDITDADWVNDTGVAADGGVLGITSFDYACDTNGDGRREPYQDADVVLNGTPDNVISAYDGVCGGRPCPSSTTVLMHELGHAVGLGHPCPLCETALMSASLIVNDGEPLPDDTLSLLGLYGGAGDLGQSCGANGDCDSGDCGSFAGLSYCTQSCGACPAGFTCSGGNCEIASSVDAVFPGVGDACGFTCVDDCFAGQPAGSVIRAGCNACLAVSGTATCAKGCSKSTGDGCDLANEFCSGLGTPDDQGQCKPRRGVGGACADDSFCLAGLTCVASACAGVAEGEGEGDAGEGEGEGDAAEGEGDAAEGEGDAGEGEGDVAEGEGEGDVDAPGGCGCATSSPGEVAWSFAGLALLALSRRFASGRRGRRAARRGSLR